MIDIENVTYEELLKEYKYCQSLWSKYSCDCFGFYIDALHKKILELDGFKMSL